MDNKQLGIMLLIACILLGGLVFAFDKQLSIHSSASCECAEAQESGFCPMNNKTPWQTYAGVVLISAVASLGLYLIFFEKSQKEIISTLEKQKQIQTEQEKFDILFKGLNEDGITQQTLRLRVDMHKSKLSIVLDGLEKKGLIKREDKGKTKQVFLKLSF